MSFTGKVVIVTGSSSGIGAQIATDFAKQGADAVLVGRNETKLNSVASTITVAVGKKPLIIKADLSKDEEAKRIIDETIEKFGKLDILVNNAGFGIQTDFLDEDAVGKFDSIFNTNFRAVVVLTHKAVPHIIEAKGNIINISSIASKLPTPSVIAYRTSKAALDHFSRCLALKLAPKGVRVNIINPGPVKTDIFVNLGLDEKTADSIYEGMKQDAPLKRVSDPEEISDMALFLASDKARGITGSNFFIENGQLMAPFKGLK